MRVTGPVLRLLTAATPLALTPLWLHLIGNGTLDFGSGDKDIFILVPWVIWSLFYFLSCMVLWGRGVKLGRAAALAGTIASALLLVAFLLLAVLAEPLLGAR